MIRIVVLLLTLATFQEGDDGDDNNKDDHHPLRDCLQEEAIDLKFSIARPLNKHLIAPDSQLIFYGKQLSLLGFLILNPLSGNFVCIDSDIMCFSSSNGFDRRFGNKRLVFDNGDCVGSGKELNWGKTLALFKFGCGQ